MSCQIPPHSSLNQPANDTLPRAAVPGDFLPVTCNNNKSWLHSTVSLSISLNMSATLTAGRYMQRNKWGMSAEGWRRLNMGKRNDMIFFTCHRNKCFVNRLEGILSFFYLVLYLKCSCVKLKPNGLCGFAASTSKGSNRLFYSKCF